MEAKPIEVIMRIDFATSDGKQIVAHAEKVQELIRCRDCKHLSTTRIAPNWNRVCTQYGVGKKEDGFCDEVERGEDE